MCVLQYSHGASWAVYQHIPFRRRRLGQAPAIVGADRRTTACRGRDWLLANMVNSAFFFLLFTSNGTPSVEATINFDIAVHSRYSLWEEEQPRYVSRQTSLLVGSPLLSHLSLPCFLEGAFFRSPLIPFRPLPRYICISFLSFGFIVSRFVLLTFRSRSLHVYPLT